MLSWPILAQPQQQDLVEQVAYVVTGADVSHPSSWSSADWRDAAQVRDDLEHPDAALRYWVRIDPTQVMTGFLRIAGQAKVDVWNGLADRSPLTIGFYRPMHRLPVRGDPYVLPVDSLRSQDTYIRVTPFAQQPYPIRIQYLTEPEYINSKRTKFASGIGYHMYLGAGVIALLFLMGFALFQYIEHRRKAYLFYGLYMLCMALYFGRILEYYYETPVFWGFFYEGYGLAEIVALMISYVMYVQFARTFLDLDKQIPGLLLLFRLWIGLCLLTALAGIGLSLFQLHSALFWQVHSALKLFMLLLVVYFLWRIARERITLSNYVIWGSGFLLLGSVGALMVTFVFTGTRGQLLGEPMFYMLSGTMLEAFCFAMGLGRLARQAELDRITAQHALIKQLEREGQLEREVQESRIQMLRAQMNPHFIFNALNSIQHFILSNQKEKSVRYLTQFSRLIRRILQNSNERELSLTEEIETLKAYIEIEQIRFHPAFSYELDVADDINPEDTYIPQLVIQPIVENAIVHGLAPGKSDGMLRLTFQLDGPTRLRVLVEDNGIGRSVAGQVSGRRTGHTSISSRSIRDRLAILLPDVQDPLKYEDLVNSDGTPAGTRVTLVIPVVR